MRLDWETLQQVAIGPATPYALGNAALQLRGLARWWLKDEMRLLAAEDGCGHPQFTEHLRVRPRLPDTPGSCWVIFVLASPEKLSRLRPAVVLPLKWVAGKNHSPFLPAGLRSLATEVANSLAGDLVSGRARWGLQLHPIDGIDRLDLSDLRFDCDSGWASLASGLLLADADGRPDPAIWATGCGGSKKHLPTVGELPAKLKLARDWEVRKFFAPRSMRAEAQRWCEDHECTMEIGDLDLAEGRPVAALRDLLSSLDMPPLDESGVTSRAQEWYLREYDRNRNRAADYYRRDLLPHIVCSCQAKIRAAIPVLPTHLVTIASDNQEQISLGARTLAVTHCQVFHTQEKPIEPWLEDELCRLGIKYVPQRFDGGGDLVAQFSTAVKDFTAGIAPQQVVFDLTPGTKLMSLTLALRVAGRENWLYYLRHDRRGNLVVPGSESPQLWRFGETWGEADSSCAKQTPLS